MSREVPFFRPRIGQAEIDGAVSSLKSGWLTTGPKTREFESRFAEAVGAEHAVALNSATAALHLSLVAKDIGPGDEVIIPTLTFAAGAEIVLAVGATPVFVDSDANTLGIDIEAALAAVSEKTRAIMPMHYGGLPVDLDPLLEVARERADISIIEDAAHAFPAVDATGHRVGSRSHGACFSFYANKTITTGEGGMFTTNDAESAERVRQLSLHGLSRNAWKRFETRASWDYDIVEPGWKYNLTDLAAAIGLAQLDAAGSMAEARRSLVNRYDEAFRDLSTVSPVALGKRDGSAAHLYVIRIHPDAGVTRTDVIDHLRSSGIGTSVHYRPLHMHSYYRDSMGFSEKDFPVAATAFSEMLSLPLYPDLTIDDQLYVIDHVLEAVGGD